MVGTRDIRLTINNPRGRDHVLAPLTMSIWSDIAPIAAANGMRLKEIIVGVPHCYSTKKTAPKDDDVIPMPTNADDPLPIVHQMYFVYRKMAEKEEEEEDDDVEYEDHVMGDSGDEDDEACFL